MSFHRGLLILIIFAGLGAGCSQDQATPPVVPGGVVTTPGLSVEIKRCMDTRIGQIIETSDEDIQAVNAGFATAMQACAMTEQQKTQYLAYTNVLAGVLPDSVGDDVFAELKTVVNTQTFRRGTIEVLFTNGWAVVRWDGDPITSTVKLAELSPEVRARAGVAYPLEVIQVRDGRKGLTEEVYASGLAQIRFEGAVFSNVVRTNEVSPRVTCLDGFCTRADVIHNSTLRRGFLTAVYANKMARVRWNGNSFDSTVTLGELSTRVVH